MTNREKLMWLPLSVLITTMIGWVVVNTGYWNGYFEILAWFVFFVVNWLVLKSFWYAVAWTVTAAALEDFLYIVIQNSAKQEWIWYSHSWVKDLPVPFSKYFGYDWGVPSGYFLQPIVSLIIAIPRYFRWYHKLGTWLLDGVYNLVVFRRAER
jgi:hypothetical protein